MSGSGSIKSITVGGKTFDVADDDMLSDGYSSGSLSDRLADTMEGVVARKNEALKGIFKDFTLKEIKEKGDCRTLLDGSEVYSLGDVDIVKFYPPSVVTETVDECTRVMRVEQKYQRLDR